MAPGASSYAGMIWVALCLSSLAVLARTQAPGDREQSCLDDPSHPQYDDHVRPLLDTRDYGELLPYESDGTGGVWQTLNIDEDTHKWGTNTAEYCKEITHVCGRSSGPQNNWMITQHISVPVNVKTVQVMIDSTLVAPCPPSTPSCVEDISLYVWEISIQNRTLAADTNNYHFVADISSGESVIEISPVSQSGFYLGIRDNGSCVSLSRVLVYYSVCESGREGLVRVDQNTSAGNTLQGHCVENSVSTSDSGPQLMCQESGQWMVVSGCQCSTHYFLDNSRQQCLRPPLAPGDVRVSDVTNQTLTLSWYPPPTDGSPLYDLHYTISYGDQRMTVEGVTELNVTELTPFFSYTFSVTAENSVSSQDPNTAARTASVSVTTLEGVAGRVEEIEIREGAGEVFISWSEPNPPHGIILHYYIKIIESGKETIIKDYNSNSISWDTWTNNWKITTSENVKIQIQAATKIGRGEYSEAVNVSRSATSTDATQNTPSWSGKFLIVAIVVPLVIAVLILTAFIIVQQKCIIPKGKSSSSVANTAEFLSHQDTANTELSLPDSSHEKHEQFEFSYNKNPSYEMVRSCRAYRSEGLGHCQATSCKPSLEAELGVCSNEGFGALESANDAIAYPGGTGPIYQEIPVLQQKVNDK